MKKIKYKGQVYERVDKHYSKGDIDEIFSNAQVEATDALNILLKAQRSLAPFAFMKRNKYAIEGFSKAQKAILEYRDALNKERHELYKTLGVSQ